jgi:hypothetical protein
VSVKGGKGHALHRRCLQALLAQAQCLPPHTAARPPLLPSPHTPGSFRAQRRSRTRWTPSASPSSSGGRSPWRSSTTLARVGGRPCRACAPDGGAALPDRRLRRPVECRALRQPSPRQQRAARPAGAKFWNLLSITPVLDAEGLPMSLIGVQSNITELMQRKEAEKALVEAKVGLFGVPVGEGREWWWLAGQAACLAPAAPPPHPLAAASSCRGVQQLPAARLAGKADGQPTHRAHQAAPGAGQRPPPPPTPLGSPLPRRHRRLLPRRPPRPSRCSWPT